MLISFSKHPVVNTLYWSRRSCIVISPLHLSCADGNRSVECPVADLAHKWVVRQKRAGTQGEKYRIAKFVLLFIYFFSFRRSIAHWDVRAQRRLRAPRASQTHSRRWRVRHSARPLKEPLDKTVIAPVMWRANERGMSCTWTSAPKSMDRVCCVLAGD